MMYKIDWYIQICVYTFRFICMTTWLIKYSNLNDEKIHIMQDQNVVVGFQGKYPSNNYYVLFLLIAYLELRKPWKLEFVAFDFDICVSGPAW